MKNLYCVISFIIIFLYSGNAQFTWDPLDGPEGVVTPYMISNDSFTFIPDREFLYRTDDGLKWQSFEHPVSTLMAANKDTMVNIFFDRNASIGRLQISFDNGESWTVKDIPNNLDHHYANIALCSHGLYIYKTDVNQLYRSTNLGDSWELIAHQGYTGYRFFAIEDRLYLQQDQELAMSDLQGESWLSITPTIHPQRRIVDVVAIDQHILVSDLGFGGVIGSIWHSHDYGSSWVEAKIKTTEPLSDNVIHKAGINIYASTQGYVLKSADFGFNWDTLTEMGQALIFHGMGSVKGILLYSTTHEGIYRWDEVAQKFVQNNEGLSKGSVWDLSMSSKKIWSAGTTGIYNYDLASGEWSEKMNLPDPHWPYYNKISTNDIGWVAVSNFYEQFFYLSVDNGASWDTIHLDPNLLGLFEIILLGENILVLSDVSILSQDKGAHWDYLFAEQDLIQTNVVPFKGEHFMAGQEILYSSPDNGITWNEIFPPFKIWALGSFNEDLFAVTFENNLIELYISKDGNEWTYGGDGFPQSYPVSSFDNKGKQLFFRDNENYYVFNADPSRRSYKSPIQSLTWTLFEPGKIGNDMLFSEKEIYVGGEGLFKAQIENPFITGIKEPEIICNGCFSLIPNPAYDNLIIDFNLNNPEGNMQIFSANGVLIKSLVINQKRTELNITGFVCGPYYAIFNDNYESGIKLFVKICN